MDDIFALMRLTTRGKMTLADHLGTTNSSPPPAVALVAGIGASGKSTAATRISKRADVPLYRLDELYHSLERIAHHGSITNEVAYDLCRQMSSYLLLNLIAVRARCLVEGAWIDVRQAAKWRSNADFHPTFCGYPNTSPQERYKALQASADDGSHWIAKLPRRKAMDTLQKHIDYSVRTEKECHYYGIPFFDFSNIQEGSQALIAHYENLYGLPPDGKSKQD